MPIGERSMPEIDRYAVWGLETPREANSVNAAAGSDRPARSSTQRAKNRTGVPPNSSAGQGEPGQAIRRIIRPARAAAVTCNLLERSKLAVGFFGVRTNRCPGPQGNRVRLSGAGNPIGGTR